MSIFGNIVSKIFGHSAQAAPAGTSASPPPNAPPAAPAAAAPAAPAPAPDVAGGPAAPAPTPSGAAPLSDIDVAAILDGLVAKHGQKLDWRHSIVDLLKALDLDSSLHARKELASELHYAGSTDDTAAMNVWLIKQVIGKLAENGGKLPADLTP